MKSGMEQVGILPACSFFTACSPAGLQKAGRLKSVVRQSCQGHGCTTPAAAPSDLPDIAYVEPGCLQQNDPAGSCNSISRGSAAPPVFRAGQRTEYRFSRSGLKKIHCRLKPGPESLDCCASSDTEPGERRMSAMDRILLIRQLHSTQGKNLPEAADAAGCGRGTAGKSADPEVFNPRERDLQGREPRPSGPDPCRPAALMKAPDAAGSTALGESTES